MTQDRRINSDANRFRCPDHDPVRGKAPPNPGQGWLTAGHGESEIFERGVVGDLVSDRNLSLLLLGGPVGLEVTP